MAWSPHLYILLRVRSTLEIVPESSILLFCVWFRLVVKQNQHPTSQPYGGRSYCVDILTIGETKIDSSFPTAQFRLANCHTPYRLDIRNNSGCILVYITSNIPTRQLNCGNLCKSIQAVPFETNLRKEKWIVISIYRPPSQNSEFFSKLINKYHRSFTKVFDYYITIGDFNLEPSDTTLKHFLDSDGLHNLIKGHTCFKGKGSLIDLILTN